MKRNDMKSLLQTFSLCLLVTEQIRADLITFDDIPANELYQSAGMVPNGYGGVGVGQLLRQRESGSSCSRWTFRHGWNAVYAQLRLLDRVNTDAGLQSAS